MCVQPYGYLRGATKCTKLLQLSMTSAVVPGMKPEVVDEVDKEGGVHGFEFVCQRHDSYSQDRYHAENQHDYGLLSIHGFSGARTDVLRSGDQRRWVHKAANVLDKHPSAFSLTRRTRSTRSVWLRRRRTPKPRSTCSLRPTEPSTPRFRVPVERPH